MSSEISVVATPEFVPLSAVAQSALGLRPGSRLSVTIEEGKVTLQPLDEDDLEQLAGSLHSQPGMAEELIAERRSQKW